MAAREEMAWHFRIGPVHDDFDRFADLRYAPRQGELLLHFHKAVAPGGFHLVRQMAVEPGCGGVWLVGIRKHAEPLKLSRADEVGQLLELRVRLAREAGDERGAHRQALDRRTQLAD